MSKYIRIYEALCPYDPIARDDPRRGAIMDEMRAIHKAKTDGAAVSVIAWWNAWPNPQHQTALEFVQAARKMMSNTSVIGGTPSARELAAKVRKLEADNKRLRKALTPMVEGLAYLGVRHVRAARKALGIRPILAHNTQPTRRTR